MVVDPAEDCFSDVSESVEAEVSEDGPCAVVSEEPSDPVTSEMIVVSLVDDSSIDD